MAGSSNFSVIFRLLGKDETSGPFGRLRAGLRGIGQQASVTARALGMHRVSDGLRGVFASFGALRAQISGVGLAFAGLIGGGTAAGFYAWVTGAADAGDEVAKLGRRVGLTAEQVSGLQYAMQLTGGGSAEDANTAIRTFAKNIGDAANGTGEAKELFKAMGMSLTDSSGRLKPTSALLDDLANKMAKIKNPTERQTVAMRLFGESGGKMALVLEGGAAAMAEYVNEGRSYLGMTNRLAEASEAFKDSQLRVSSAFTFIRNGLAERLLPLLTPLNEKFAEFMRGISPAIVDRFAVAIGDLVGQVAGWFAATDGGASRAEVALFGFMNGISSLGRTVATVADVLGGWGALLAGVGLFLAAPFVAAVGQAVVAVAQFGVALAITTARTLAFMVAAQAKGMWDMVTAIRAGYTGVQAFNLAWRANPIGLVLTAVQALVGLGVVLYQQFEPFRSLVDWIAQRFADLANLVTGGAFGRALRALGITPDAPAAAVAGAGAGALPSGSPIVGGDNGPIASPQGYQPSAAAAGLPQKGEMVVRFEGAPPGTRVETRKAQGMDLTTDLDVGNDWTGMAD